MNIFERNKDGFLISTDSELLDTESIHNFLSQKSYWCKNIPLETVKKSLKNSLNFGMYFNGQQVGFARVLSDLATIAYLGDVYVLEEFRGLGLSKWLMKTIEEHPDLKGLRRWILLTQDAHGLYEKFGWMRIASPEFWMERHNKDVYKDVKNELFDSPEINEGLDDDFQKLFKGP